MAAHAPDYMLLSPTSPTCDRWTSSFDGRALSVDQMEEWVSETVRRIRMYGGKRILEVRTLSTLLWATPS